MTGIHFPQKRFGQNFLTNQYYATRIIDSLELSPEDSLVEIGPGRGILTKILSRVNCKDKIALEIDPQLIDYLQKEFSPHIRILQQDILTFSFKEIYKQAGKSVKVVGNIPYNITSPIIFHILDNSSYISRAVLMVQKEVAARLTADKDSKEYGILTVMVNSQAKVENLFDVGRKNFFPIPKVDSTVVRLTINSDQLEYDSQFDTRLFKTIVQSTFNNRRKMLKNTLKKIITDNQLNMIKSVSLNDRPENLSLEDFRNLTREIWQLKQINP
ncbi:16S rRNA (adenine(1518)-N(6)/adenine(1519)-N(6))-dimethyltransferase RsmA [Calditrichota bacterium]